MINRILPLLIIFAGTGLRLAFLNHSLLWYDEIYTTLISRLPFDRMIQAIAGDVHPPFYYLITAMLIKLPLSPELSLRGFSALCSVTALVLFWKITGLLKVSYRARLLALLVLASMAVEIRYAQEARMYALLQLLVLLQWLFVLKRKWIPLCIVSIILLYTHNYGLFYTGIIYLIGILNELKTERATGREKPDLAVLKAPVLSGMVAGLSFLPWFFFTTLNQMGTISTSYWIQPVTLGSTLIALFQILWSAPLDFWAVVVAGPATGLLIAAALAHGVRTRQFDLLLLACGPLLAAIIGSLIWHPILLARALIGSIPALVILLAEAAFQRRAWFWSVPVGIMLIITFVTMMQSNIQGNTKADEQIVIDIPGSNKVVAHMNDLTLLPYLYYRPDLANYLLETGCPPGPGSLSTATRQAMGLQTISRAALRSGNYIAGSFGGISTACDEQLFNELSKQSHAIEVYPDIAGMVGLWQLDK